MPIKLTSLRTVRVDRLAPADRSDVGRHVFAIAAAVYPSTWLYLDFSGKKSSSICGHTAIDTSTLDYRHIETGISSRRLLDCDLSLQSLGVTTRLPVILYVRKVPS